MKNVKLILKDDDVKILDLECESKLQGKYWVFNNDNYEYKVSYNKDYFHLIRNSNDNVFELKFKDNNITSKITLHNPKIEMPLKIEKFKLNLEDKNVIVKYNIESDIDHEKTIIFTLID